MYGAGLLPVRRDSLPLLPEKFIVVSTLCLCFWCRVSCCLLLEMKSSCLLKYNQSRIAQARDMQVEENQDQSMKGCSINSER